MDHNENGHWGTTLVPAALVVLCCAAPFLVGGLATGLIVLVARGEPSVFALAALLAVGVAAVLVLRQRAIMHIMGAATRGSPDRGGEPREPMQARPGAGGIHRSIATLKDSPDATGAAPLWVRILKTPGCVSCARVERNWEELRPEYAGRVQVEVVDLLEQPDVALRYGILRSPAVVIDEQVRAQGALDAVRLRALLDRALRERAEPTPAGESTRA